MPVANATSSPLYLDDRANYIDGDPSTFSIQGAPGTAPIDGISCSPSMSGTTHYHAHITVVVNGVQQAVNSGIGIYDPQVASPPYFVNANTSDPSACYYDVHVHAGMGIIHIEASTAHVHRTLGQFLDIWGKGLSPIGFGSFSGPTRWFDTDESPSQTPGSHPVTELTGTDPHLSELVNYHEYTIEVGPTYVNTRNFTWSTASLAGPYGYP